MGISDICRKEVYEAAGSVSGANNAGKAIEPEITVDTALVISPSPVAH